MTSTSAPAARRPRAIPIVPIVVIVAAFFVGMYGASRLSTALSSHPVSWDLSTGIGGPAFDRATAQSSSVIHLAVQWPGCVETGDHSWLTPEVSYMPWSVTITLRTTDTYAAKCSQPEAGGRLPRIGYYLSPLPFPVQLSEPLGDRPLFDGSTSPATERYRP